VYCILPSFYGTIWSLMMNYCSIQSHVVGKFFIFYHCYIFLKPKRKVTLFVRLRLQCCPRKSDLESKSIIHSILLMWQKIVANYDILWSVRVVSYFITCINNIISLPFEYLLLWLKWGMIIVRRESEIKCPIVRRAISRLGLLYYQQAGSASLPAGWVCCIIKIVSKCGAVVTLLVAGVHSSSNSDTATAFLVVREHSYE